MRTYDSPGNVITFTVPAADYDLYTAGDLPVVIGEHVGITEGPVDTTTGEVNVAVDGVFHCKVEHTGATASNVAVYITDDLELTTAEGGTSFGKLINSIEAGTSTVRVKLNG